MSKYRVWFSVEDRGYKTPCHVWNGRVTPWGYSTISRGGKTHLGHIWFYEELIGKVPDGLELDHLCRVRSCVNPHHLEPVTPAENVWRSSLAKLKKADIPVIEDRYHRGETQENIAAAYKVSQSAISAIICKSHWRGICSDQIFRGNTKITEHQIKAIRQGAANGKSSKLIADECGISHKHAKNVIIGRAWSSVPGSIESKRSIKLDLQQVADIRSRASAGEMKKIIALSYDVTPQQIGRIVRGTSWSSVGMEA